MSTYDRLSRPPRPPSGQFPVFRASRPPAPPPPASVSLQRSEKSLQRNRYRCSVCGIVAVHDGIVTGGKGQSGANPVSLQRFPVSLQRRARYRCSVCGSVPAAATPRVHDAKGSSGRAHDAKGSSGCAHDAKGSSGCAHDAKGSSGCAHDAKGFFGCALQRCQPHPALQPRTVSLQRCLVPLQRLKRYRCSVLVTPLGAERYRTANDGIVTVSAGIVTDSGRYRYRFLQTSLQFVHGIVTDSAGTKRKRGAGFSQRGEP